MSAASNPDDRVQPLKTVCTCGHDLASHFERGLCLALGDCSCRKYEDANAPKPRKALALNAPYRPRMAAKPHDDERCNCDACYWWQQARDSHYSNSFP